MEAELTEGYGCMDLVGKSLVKTSLEAITGQLARSSVETYRYDIQHFQHWLSAADVAVIGRADMIAYRWHLAEKYKPATAARMWAVARRCLKEAVKLELISKNPADDIAGIKVGSQDSPHSALSLKQCSKLLNSIERHTAIGKRDYAILLLLIKTGIRRSELAALKCSNIKNERGWYILEVEKGKGNKRRIVKLDHDILVALELAMLDRQKQGTELPLFSPVRLPYKSTLELDKQPLGISGIEKMVRSRAARHLGIKLSPHCLRATFVTLALEGGAKLEQVQYAAGHADPRTTELYQRRKEKLEDSPIDYIHLSLNWPPDL